ncbi:MAG: MFS transporter [Pseudomonadales bacterium]|nr:MFS transporter [Pseudomonadales bacterium]
MKNHKFIANKTVPASVIVLLTSLYFAQGFPAGLLVQALPPILRDAGVPVEYIGLLKLLAVPWVLKFLWAPFLDRFYSDRLGAHRGWILIMQFGLVAILVLLSFFSPYEMSTALIVVFLLLLFVMNTGCATQDIATDGLAVKLLVPEQRGIGNSIQVSGYKLGMMLGGAAILFGMDVVGWQWTFLAMAGTMVLLTVPVYLFREAPQYGAPSNVSLASSTQTNSFLGLFVGAYKGFVSQPGILLWLVVLLTYKVADSLASAMIKPLLIDLNYSLTEVGQITLVSSVTGLIGAIAGGYIYVIAGAKRCLIGLGVLQALSLGAYGLVETQNLNHIVVYIVACAEQMLDGMTTVALFALMMDHCRKGSESTDYTVQACLQIVIAGLGAVSAGIGVKFLGYAPVFYSAAALGLVALIPVWLLFRRYPKGSALIR